ncbi:hypothetical protein AMS68_000313 [Peltaster fructicola]|uniref:Inosine/uridine-preferring nucleoside hydrolase domain-containing protein n=1 Tax=Peltaster fructicola TaxID=286661 RepID=A0A6H0XJA3_9PEZI|nr:hypothetical protein AMS68_000313 [Peltaster fructicola]
MGPFDPRKVIIDCSAELEDVLALLKAFASGRRALEVLLISVTNLSGRIVPGLDNVVSMFDHLKEELMWRRQKHYRIRYDELEDPSNRPVVSVGCDQPLESSTTGLALSEIWQNVHSDQGPTSFFTASRKPAHEEILQVLRDNEPGSITIVAIGPLTTIATAARSDPDTFLRAKEVLVVGGSMDATEILAKPENNISQDPLAAAQLFALTSSTPSSTMPLAASYPEHLDSLPRLRILLFPQSSTKGYAINRTDLQGFARAGDDSPLLLWIKPTLELSDDDDLHSSRLHVPGTMALTYAATSFDYEWSGSDPKDIRVNLTGDTTGLYVVEESNTSCGNQLYIRYNEAPSSYGLILVPTIFTRGPPSKVGI